MSGVEAKALTLDRVQVDVTVSDDGGQPVLEYIVSQAWEWEGCICHWIASAMVDGCMHSSGATGLSQWYHSDVQ